MKDPHLLMICQSTDSFLNRSVCTIADLTHLLPGQRRRWSFVGAQVWIGKGWRGFWWGWNDFGANM